MASEVPSDLNFKRSGLNGLCSSASLASMLLEKPFQRKKGRKEGQNGLVDLRADAADKKLITTRRSEISVQR